MSPLFTIGHSNHPIGAFTALLQRHAIATLCDVRSIPGSRRFPQFGRQRLEEALRQAGISYEWWGETLGGRPAQGPAPLDYGARARDPAFRASLDRLVEAVSGSRTALMCAERDPMDCHRALLVCRNLRGRGLAISHILADGALETQDAFEARLVARSGRKALPLLDGPASGEAAIAAAYDTSGLSD
jgi:uncharacterized protein (DUF488 family)